MHPRAAISILRKLKTASVTIVVGTARLTTIFENDDVIIYATFFKTKMPKISVCASSSMILFGFADFPPRCPPPTAGDSH